MNLFVLSGHGSESFAAFLNGVILQQKNNAAVITAAVITTHHESDSRFRYKLRYLVICAVVTATVITAAFFVFCNITLFKNTTKDSLPCPTIQTNSFCFGENITVFPCPMSIYKFIFILSRNPFYQ